MGDWFQIRKGVHQGCILSPCLFNLYAEYVMKNAGLEEAQAGIKIEGEISITLHKQMTPPLWLIWVQMYDPGQAAQPLWASVSLSAKWG